MRSEDYLEIMFWDILDPSNRNKSFPQPLTTVFQSVWAFVCLSDHNPCTHGQICLQYCL